MMRGLFTILFFVLLTTGLYAKKAQRVARVVDPCEELALNEGTHLRAVGTSKSSIEKVARSEALRDARTQLAQRMRVAVESVATDYAKSSNENSKEIAQTLSQSVTTQYFAQYVESSRPIKWSIYDLSDGRIEVYVCVEMLQSEDASLQNLINELNNDDLINSKPERDKIINELKKSLDSYREQLSK